MFTPLATAARTAAMPEWNRVPSPMFWMRCSSSTNGAIPNHWAPSLPIAVRPTMWPTRSGSINITMLWQPMPAPTSAPSGTFVDELCGQPEQKNGERLTDSGMSCRCTAGSGVMRLARRGASRVRSRAAMVSASSVPVNGNSGCSSGVSLPLTDGWLARPNSAPLTSHSRFGAFSSTTTTSRRPAANSRTCAGSSGTGMPSLNSRMPAECRSSVVRKPSRRSASTVSWYVCPLATMPIQSSGPRTATALRWLSTP